MKILDKKVQYSIEQVCSGYGKCNEGCGCRLLVERDDIYVTYNLNYIIDNEPHFTFRCPNCKRETDIPENLLPEYVKNSLTNSYSMKLIK